MSASSKKKLRAEQNEIKLTERQLAEQKEAKQLKIYTTVFVIAVVALLVTALAVGITQTVKNSGVRERNTVAMTVGTEEVSNAMMSYYYVNYVQSFATQNSYLLSYMMDTTKPLDEQVYNEETGETWADYFLAAAQAEVHNTYVRSAAAKAAGFTLTEAETSSIENNISTMELYGQLYGYGSGEAYLKAMYGKGSTLENYREYCEQVTLANSYYTSYASSLTYEDAQRREHEAEIYNNFSSYSYHNYYMSVSSFLEGGTTNEDGTVTYSDEENAAAEAAALEAAKALTDADNVFDPESLDLAISALPINAGSETPVKSSLYEDQLFSSINEDVAKWLTGNRKENDVTYIARETTTENEDGTTTTSVVGYYIVMYVGSDENLLPLRNVRHILVSFEGGTTDENGAVTYSEEEIAAAKAKAEDLLAQWEAGDKTEDSFAALANEHSTDGGSNTNGGLYENVYPGQMVTSFEDWTFGDRKAGDTGIVESTYGFHVMYYSGLGDLTYRDHLINQELLTAELTQWSDGLLEASPVVIGKNTYLPLGLVLGQ